MSQSSFNNAKISGQPAISGKAKILLCLKNKADQELFLNQLSDRYDFIISDLESYQGDFDICILDYSFYSKHRNTIEEIKATKAPLLVPFILLAKVNVRSHFINPDTNIIDEVVTIPTQISVLVSRIEAMLTIRMNALLLKQKNQELEEKNAKLNLYEKALNSANSGIVITDTNQTDNPISFVNEAFLEITGYSRGEVVGKNCRFLQNYDRDQNAINKIRTLLSEGREGSVVLRNYKKDGTLFWNELKIAPIKDSEDQIVNFVGIQNDITDRVEILDKISEERNLFKKLTDSSPIGIVIINQKGQITFANDQAEGMLGLTRSEITELTYNDPVWDIKDVDGRPFPADQLPFSLVNKTKEAVYNVVHQIRWPNGTVKILSVNAAPLFDKKGEIDSVIASISDITENERSKLRLRESLKEKEVLLQEIHHRVKNNLAVISALLQIQRFNSDDERLNKALEGSEMRIKSMALIHEKLYQSESLSEIDFKDYIEDLSTSLVSTIEVGTQISTICQCESIELNVNQAVPCALILNEIISNAVEHAFTGQKEGEIKVILKERDQKVYLKIRDNGKGFPEKFLNREAMSMGSTIIQALVTQLDADFIAENDDGAVIELSFMKKDGKGASSNLF